MMIATIAILHYHIDAELFRSTRTIIYRALRDSDQMRVIVKTLNNDYPSNYDITRFKHEFRMPQKMAGAGAIRSGAWDAAQARTSRQTASKVLRVARPSWAGSTSSRRRAHRS